MVTPTNSTQPLRNALSLRADTVFTCCSYGHARILPLLHPGDSLMPVLVAPLFKIIVSFAP